MLTDKKIRDIFIECDNLNPDGLYANDLDIMEFGRKLDEAASKAAALEEREICVRFVKSLNSEVATALEEWRRWQDRSMS